MLIKLEDFMEFLKKMSIQNSKQCTNFRQYLSSICMYLNVKDMLVHTDVGFEYAFNFDLIY